MRRRKRNVIYSSADDDYKERKTEKPKVAPKSMPVAQQIIRIRREKKGRGGKQVTVLYDFQLTEQDLTKLGKQLKKFCGSGGTVKAGGIIEIQGDHRDRVANLLQKQGFKTKFTGG